MNRLRWKLLASMLAVVLATVAFSALFARRVVLQQVRKVATVQGGAPVAPVTFSTRTERPAAAIDRRVLLTFGAAALVAIAATLLLSKRITAPLERLTAAVEEMARGRQPAHVAVSGSDEIAQLARAFNTMADAIARQESLRRRMVSDVAHELRTPLTNLRCEIETLQDGLARADSSRLASLHEEVLHLGRLADDLQDLAVSEAGALQMERQRIDLAASVARAADAFRRDHVEIRIVSDGPVVVDGDPTRISQIVRNLLDNAVRYATRIDIDVRCNAGDALLTVADNGPGIPPADIEAIFERFYRVDPSRQRNSGGAGLGLAIVRRLVELHGGRVWAENVPDGGARFRVRLPLAS